MRATSTKRALATLDDRVRQFSDRLASEIHAVVAEQIDTLLDRAPQRFRDGFLTPSAAPIPSPEPAPLPPPIKRRTTKPIAIPPPAATPRPDRRAAIASRADAAKPAAGKRAKMRCRTCGEFGFRSDGCGRTHNVKPTPDSSESDAEGEVPMLLADLLDDPQAEVDPFVRAEPMARRQLVAALVEDPATVDRDVVASRDPELSATDKREVCPIHGWVGRLVFQRDRHDICAGVTAIGGIPCSRCEGRRFTIVGDCKRCMGSGIEPAEVPEVDIDEDETPEAPTSVRVLLPGDNAHNRHRNPDVLRSKTIGAKRITRAFLDEEEPGIAPFIKSKSYADLVAQRPRTRGDCAGGQRPCPWVSCSHHLYLEVNEETGSLKLRFPDRDVDAMAESCVLDVADAGEHTLEQIGELCNLTRERTRQIEMQGMFALKAGAPHLFPERTGE